MTKPEHPGRSKRRTRLMYLQVAVDLLRAPISAEAKLICAAIRYRANGTGECSDSYREIGAVVGLDKRAVMRVLPALISSGFVIEAGGGKGLPKHLTAPSQLVRFQDRCENDTGSDSEPVSGQDRFADSTGPVPKLNRTGTKSVPPYKEEEINKEIKRSSGDERVSDGQQENGNGDAPKPSERRRWFTEGFWPEYPRHVGKAEAEKAFLKVATSAEEKDRVMAALRAQRVQLVESGLKYCPHASKWLNQRRFEDEFEADDAGDAAPAPYLPAEDDE